MHIVRRFLLIIITPLFTALLFATAFDWGIIKTIGNPASVKKIVAESGIYNSVVPSLLTQAGQITSNVGNISLSDPGVQQVADQVFSPQYVQAQTNTVIDSIYNWLEGKTPQPDFHVDLSGAKGDFANGIAAQVQQRLSNLPKCTNSYTSTSFDVYNATCLPPGVTPIAAAKTAHDAVIGGQGFLDNPVVSAASVKSSGSNQSVFADQFKNLPKQYRRAKQTPTILIILSLLAGAAIFLLSSSHRRGLRHVATTLIFVGIVMLAFSWGLNRVVSKNIAPRISVNNAVVQDKARTLITDLSQRIDKNFWVFGGVYAVLGAVALAAPMLIRPRHDQHSDHGHQAEGPEPAPAGEAETPSSHPAMAAMSSAHQPAKTESAHRVTKIKIQYPTKS